MSGMKMSANLGYLWTGHPLGEAVSLAAAAGFTAVEFHWPYKIDPVQLKFALDDAGVPALSLNTARGDIEAGACGLSALPGREGEARSAIDHAIEYAAKIGARSVQVLPGYAEGEEARKTFIEHLGYALDRAEEHWISIHIEPMNARDYPGYFLNTAEQAADIISSVGRDGLSMVFDCYHEQIMGGDLTRRFSALAGVVGHVQFASVPSRAEPDEGEICYHRLLSDFRDLGYQGYFGAEYLPRRKTEDGIGWLKPFLDDADDLAA